MSVQNLHMTLQTSVSGQVDEAGLSLWLPAAVDTETDPASIETGISCGMSDMCGEDPCLCGVPDSYGCCACNGLQTTCPTITVESSNPGVAQVFVFDGKSYVVGLLPGEAEITTHASLIHYSDVSTTTSLTVGFGPGTVGVIAAAVLLVAVLVGAVKGVRRVLRKKDTSDD